MPAFKAAALEFNFNIHTLRNRFHGLRGGTRQEAHAHQRIISQLEEDVTVEWMIQKADEGDPVFNMGLASRMKKLSGKQSSMSWILRFRERNYSLLKFCGSSGLDPKRAQAFNLVTTGRHFVRFGKARQRYSYAHARVCVDTLMHHPCVQFLHAPTRIVSWWTWVDPHSVTPRLRLLQYNTHLWGPSLFNSLPRVEFSTIITFLSKRAPRRILPVPRPEQ